jgi:hypothetical protein
MVGDGNGSISENLNPADMLGRDERAVAEESVRMKINHIAP